MIKNALLIVGFAFTGPSIAFARQDLPEGIEVAMHRGAEGHYILEGRFSVPVPAADVWAVLADYEGLADVVSSVVSSKRIERTEFGWKIEQVMRGRVGPFRRKVFLALDVREVPTSSIAFEDVSGKSFDGYVGSWTVLEVGNRTEVVYALAARPKFAAPKFIVGDAFRRSVAELLNEVRGSLISGRRGDPERLE